MISNSIPRWVLEYFAIIGFLSIPLIAILIHDLIMESKR